MWQAEDNNQYYTAREENDEQYILYIPDNFLMNRIFQCNQVLRYEDGEKRIEDINIMGQLESGY